MPFAAASNAVVCSRVSAFDGRPLRPRGGFTSAAALRTSRGIGIRSCPHSRAALRSWTRSSTHIGCSHSWRSTGLPSGERHGTGMARVFQHVIRPPTEVLGADRPTTATAIKSRLADLKSIRIDQDRHPDLVFPVSATGDRTSDPSPLIPSDPASPRRQPSLCDLPD